MDARTLTDFEAQLHLAGLPRVGRGMALALLSLLGVLALVLCARRIGGVELHSPSTALLWLCGLLLACGALVFRLLMVPSHEARHDARSQVLWLLPSAVLLLWCLGLTFRENSLLGTFGLWGLVVAEEGWSWRRLLANWPAAGAPRKPAITSGIDLESKPLQSLLAEPVELAREAEATEHWVRRRTADAGEAIEGWLRVDLQPGQRHANAHLAICPALACTPQCFVEQTDGPPATIEIGQALPYGVRFDIRLDHAATEPACVLLDFSIQERAVEQ